MNPIETRIESVTVYTDRALITRRGEAQLSTGASEVLLAGLPANLDTDSLRASGRGEVGVRIIGVEARLLPLTEASNESAREVEREFNAARDAGSALDSESTSLENRSQTLQKLSSDAARWFAESLSKGESSLDNVTALLDYVSNQTRQLDADKTSLEAKKRDNAALQNALSERLAQFQYGRRPQQRGVAVLVEANGEGKWELELEYVVSNASWTPLYDARVSTNAEKERFELGLNALVTQASGEDWKDVALTLSTARPGLGTLPPKLDPAWIDVPRPVYASAPPAMAMPSPPMPMASRAKRSSSDEAVAFGGAYAAPQSAPEPIEAVQVEASVESDGSTVEFALPHRLGVPSDGQTHRVAIATREFPTKFDYFAVPKRVEVAYLRTTATNTSGLSLLQGNVSIFRDGVFVGKANLKNTAPNAEFTLFLGPDEQVRAKREMTLRETDKNLLGSQKRVHFAYSIELQNLKARSVKVVVQDQIPVSRSENIKVKLRGSNPEATTGELGLLNWEQVLAPNEKRIIRFDFGVETPRETTIVGLTD
ncbi:mucoidy inhibitor MuiA family protein [bacterium]|nr:MAG: mucoidy inhibitor MuiA family protein [bacterium]